MTIPLKTPYENLKKVGKFKSLKILARRLSQQFPEKTYEQHFLETVVFNFGNTITETVIAEYALGFGAPKIAVKYNLTNTLVYNILEFSGVERRNMKESSKIGAIHMREANIAKYGVPCTLQVKEFDEKRKQTFLDNYGVDNPFKIKNFHEKVEQSYIKKYGYGLKTRRSIKSKEVWAAKTNDERVDWVARSFHSNVPVDNNIKSSSLEAKVKQVLDDYEVSYSTQFRAGSGLKRGSYAYDIFVPSGNLIIEVNGTYFHADPRLYKANDLIEKSQKLAKDIWQYDEKKKKYATEKGYSYLTIWELDLKTYSDKEIMDVIYDAIYENQVN